jgi:hypothetical protein
MYKPPNNNNNNNNHHHHHHHHHHHYHYHHHHLAKPIVMLALLRSIPLTLMLIAPLSFTHVYCPQLYHGGGINSQQRALPWSLVFLPRAAAFLRPRRGQERRPEGFGRRAARARRERDPYPSLSSQTLRPPAPCAISRTRYRFCAYRYRSPRHDNNPLLSSSPALTDRATYGRVHGHYRSVPIRWTC